MCLNETYVSKHLSDMFPVRNGLKQDALSPLFFDFALEYTIRRVQVNQDGLRMVHISFWFMLMMLTYWEEAYIPQRKSSSFHSG
jgi:hypothetical protein